MGFTTRKPKSVVQTPTQFVPYYDLEFDGLVLENVTYLVGRHIMTEYRKGIRGLKTEEEMSAFTEKFKQNWFTNRSGRTALLFDNLSRINDGMLYKLVSGLQGKLSYEEQLKFDILAKLLDDISKDVADMNNFYDDLHDVFGLLERKYVQFYEQSEDLTEAQIKELVGDSDSDEIGILDALISMAGKYAHPR